MRKCQRGVTDLLDARATANDTIVKAREVDVVHRPVSRVWHRRLEVDAHDGRRRVGVVGSHIDDLGRLLLIGMIDVSGRELR